MAEYDKRATAVLEALVADHDSLKVVDDEVGFRTDTLIPPALGTLVRQRVSPKRHYSLRDENDPPFRFPRQWPVHSIAGGLQVWVDVEHADLRIAQRYVCGSVMHHKVTGETMGVTDAIWLGVVIAEDDPNVVWLIDGHHSLALTWMGAKAGILDATRVGGWVHLLRPGNPVGLPRLDCDCRAAKAA